MTSADIRMARFALHLIAIQATRLKLVLDEPIYDDFIAFLRDIQTEIDCKRKDLENETNKQSS